MAIAEGMLFCYLPIYFFVPTLAKWQLGKLKEAQKAAIYGVAEKFDKQELMYVIEQIINENPRILMPVKINWYLHTVSVLFFVADISVMAFEHLVRIMPFNLNRTALFTVACVLFVIGFYLIYLQTKYFIDLKRLKEECAGKKKIRVVID